MNTEDKFPRKFRYYEALGVEKGASLDVIKKSYRMLAKKYHPDINNDPRAGEILKKLNEAYSVLSNPATRIYYDNSEAECPKCWTHEVRRIKGDKFTTYQWTCRHCGCDFQFIKHVKEEKTTKTEKKVSYRQFNCPQCKRELSFDSLILLYRCKYKKCLRVFTYKELCKYYGVVPEYIEVTKEKIENTLTKENDKTLSRVALSALFISTIVCIIMLYGVLADFSQIYLGLFLFLIAFSLLSYWVYKNPKTMKKIIKGLTAKK